MISTDFAQAVVHDGRIGLAGRQRHVHAFAEADGGTGDDKGVPIGVEGGDDRWMFPLENGRRCCSPCDGEPMPKSFSVEATPWMRNGITIAAGTDSGDMAFDSMIPKISCEVGKPAVVAASRALDKVGERDGDGPP